jgi:cell division protein FtsB
MTDLSAIAALESRLSVLMARNAELERENAALNEQVEVLRNAPTEPAPPLDCDCDLPSAPGRVR